MFRVSRPSTRSLGHSQTSTAIHTSFIFSLEFTSTLSDRSHTLYRTSIGFYTIEQLSSARGLSELRGGRVCSLGASNPDTMAPPSYPWQTYGNDENASPAAPVSVGGLGKSKKRQRGKDHIESHNSGQKRHQKHKSQANGAHVAPQYYNPAGIPLPAATTQKPVEIISLIDDDDELPQHVKPAAPRSMLEQAVYEAQPPIIGTQDAPLHIPSDPASHRPSVTAYTVPSPPPPPAAVLDASTADVVPITEPTLCKEQADLVDLILSGQNVFYTGSAGCGKSTVLKAFVKRFNERGMRVNIVAPTGRAALDINGSTTWTYAGWTPDSHKKPLLDLKRAAHGKFVRMRLMETDVLVIDEISMVENLHFERLNAVMKEARGSDAAFGGVQLVVTGDFCQLPPVQPFRHCIECGRELVRNREGTEYKCRMHGTYYDEDKWYVLCGPHHMQYAQFGFGKPLVEAFCR